MLNMAQNLRVLAKLVSKMTLEVPNYVVQNDLLGLADIIDTVNMCYNLDSAFRDTLDQAICMQNKAREGMINGGEKSRT